MKRFSVVIAPKLLISCRLGLKHRFGKPCRLAASRASRELTLPRALFLSPRYFTGTGALLPKIFLQAKIL